MINQILKRIHEIIHGDVVQREQQQQNSTTSPVLSNLSTFALFVTTPVIWS